MNVLFIEGPNEGQVHDVREHSHMWCLPRPSYRAQVMRYAPGAPLENLPSMSTDYNIHRVQLRSAGSRDVVTYVGMLPDNYEDASTAFVRYSIARLNPS